jgi:phospholipid transport system substrate-binding protein
VPTMRAVAVAIIQALGLLIAASLFIAAPAAAAEPAAEEARTPGPQELMASLSSSLFASLDKESTKTRHNSDKVVPLLDGLLSRHFDMEYAARMVLGLHWRSATPEQRQQFGVVLYQRLLRTYATSVADWTPDRFKLLPLHADPEALQVTVHALVTNSRQETVSVDFRMRRTTEGWKIFDVAVDGVSYMRIYHDDTDEEITQKGLDASIARLSQSPIVGHERPNSRGEH